MKLESVRVTATGVRLKRTIHRFFLVHGSNEDKAPIEIVKSDPS